MVQPLAILRTAAGAALMSMMIAAALVPAQAQSRAAAVAHPAALQDGAAQPFEVDMAHSTLIFSIRHLGLANFYGRVNLPRGEYLIVPDDLEASSMRITIETKNIDAGNRDRDRFLHGPDFFNVREFPTAEFIAKSFGEGDEGAILATGELTMHGETREVTATITGYGERATERFGYRSGFEATIVIKRSDFGMSQLTDTLSDEVTIIAAIGGVRR